MPSKELAALLNISTLVAQQMQAHPGLSVDHLRILFEAPHSLASEPTDYKPLSVSKSHAILYLHGGGFVTGSPSSHRKLAAHLAKTAGVQALVLDSRLSPEHAFPAQQEDSVAAYKWLLDQGFDAKRIAIAGDSAGGNLAVTSLIKAKDLGLPLPAAIIGFSPWCDMELTGKTLETNAKTDPLANREGMKQMIMAWLQGKSPTDPLANPFYTDLKGFPPMYLCAGTFEALQDNTERLADVARKAGVDVTLEMAEGMQHVYPFMAGRTPEADETIRRGGLGLKKSWVCSVEESYEGKG